MKTVSSSLKQTQDFALALLAKLAPSSRSAVLALYGDLGSGKTTFVQSLGKLLGVKQSMQSPTFVLMKSYDIPQHFKKFIHIDAYRLEKPDELARLGFNELLLDPQNIIAIEWAERVETLLPADSIKIQFTFVDENTRSFEVLE